MPEAPIAIVTGAFSHSGRHIARRLLASGHRVRTITGHPGRRSPFGKEVEAYPFDFDRPDLLRSHLEGASTLYNTFWVRYRRGGTTYDRAVGMSRTLIAAAAEAGIRRIVHLSIMNCSPDLGLPYFRGKAKVEEAIKDSGLSHAILRPAVIFGPEDVLIHNLAWILRRFPAFAIPGSGDYRVTPVFVEDLADLCVEAGSRLDDYVIDAGGPETFTFNELLELIRGAIGSRSRLFHVPVPLALVGAKVLGALTRDVVLTKEELDGLMAGLAATKSAPTAPTRLSDWLKENAAGLGREWVSELRRHFGS